MKNRLFNKRILAVLGIILVLIGIPLTTFILKNQTIFKSRASNSEEPQNVKITNVSDQSFTITYQTDEPTTGSISYGHDKKLGESELDDVDKEKESFSSKRIHSISVKNLTPATKYYLAIISGSSTFLNNGASFETTTGPNIIASPSAQQDTIKGKIVLPDGSVPSEALVYLSAENSQLLSGTIAKDGTFSFSLKYLRTDDLSSYFNINDNTVFKILATNGSLESTASASLNQTNSIPTITLSNNYDFAQEFVPIASKSARSSSGFPSVILSSGNSKPEILTPKENQSLTDQKLQFSGTSLPNEKVEIIIHSTEQLTTQVTADSNGNWIYKPLANLSPGVHTITIKTRDSSGILKTVTQSFTVYAADSQASITPTPSTVPTQKTTPTLTSPLMIVTLIPTLTTTIIPPSTIAPIGSKGGLPPTGDSRIIFVTIAAIATTAIGIVLFLLSQKMPL
jgi:hypothetical protein